MAHRTVPLPLYFLRDDELTDFIDRAQVIMLDSDTGAPELAPVITACRAELTRRGLPWSLTQSPETGETAFTQDPPNDPLA